LGVAGPDLKFYFFSTNFPGVTHDERVLRRTLANLFEGQNYRPYPGARLVADSAFTARDWIVPVQRTAVPAQQQVNTALQRTRHPVERAFGLLKERFRGLGLDGRMRLWDPRRSASIIMACVHLHNFIIESRE
jgi:hypothetical protein